jgi:cellulose synthase (UDP-forming)
LLHVFSLYMYLPKPPDYAERYIYIKTHKAALALYNFLSLAGLLTASALFATQAPWLAIYWLYIAAYGWWLSFSYVVTLVARPFRLSEHERLVRQYADGDERVDVFVPNCGEDLAVLENTFAHAARLDWPRDRLRLYCLDDRGRPEVRKLAERYGFVYLSRPDRGHMAKAGNLKYGFKYSALAEGGGGDYILVLDADFAVAPDFLRQTAPYLRADPRLAIVQTPQYFDSRDPRLNRLARGAAYVQELFYRVVQTVRDTWGGAICCGTSALYRRKALESVGGFYQIRHSEDVNTGFQLLRHGWRIRYIPLILSKGLCPDQMPAYFAQQYRWACGSLSLCFSRRFWLSPIPTMVRLNYFGGMLYYLCTAVAVLLTPLHPLVMAWFFPQNVHWYNPVFVLPAFIYTFAVMPFWHRAPWGLYALRLPVVYSWAHAFAIWDLATGNLMPWQPTGAVSNKLRRFQRFRCCCLGYSIAVTLVTYVGMGRAVATYPLYDFLPTALLAAFWLWVNASAAIDDSN